MINKKIFFFFLFSLIVFHRSEAQFKSVIEDFEGFADGQTDFSKEGIFSFGGVKLTALQHITTGNGYSGTRALKAQWTGKEWFGGWGIGLGLNKELDVNTDYLDFYFYCPKTDTTSLDRLKIYIEDDDDDNGKFETEKDDSWFYDLTVSRADYWQLISMPLADFKDGNKGGDGKFNISFKDGKLLTLFITFQDIERYTPAHYWYFDFISFSKGKLKTHDGLFIPFPATKESSCMLGAWSRVEYDLNYVLIAQDFEKNFNWAKQKKISIVSFYKPFSVDGKNIPNIFPALNDLNKLTASGYTPMVTLESHFAKTTDTAIIQPNLYSINEGHLDYYFSDWARRLKNVKGDVYLRILHEFNGDWYPWCIANNDKNPKLFIQAFQHIRQIFWKEKADNVKFIWCPNSMSTPQASWNNFMDAYPGDEYVDVVGLDVFNGAGQTGIPAWHSFRHEVMDAYFLVVEKIPNKMLIICETSSRERYQNEKGFLSDKAEWIKQMAEALKTDLSKIKAVVWFNQYEYYKVNSSLESQGAYLKYIWNDDYFK